jgi:hypothetical protein
MGNRGKREFIQVLRLMEAIPREVVVCAVTEAIRLGAIGFDAVKQIALARVERRALRGSISPLIRVCRRLPARVWSPANVPTKASIIPATCASGRTRTDRPRAARD